MIGEINEQLRLFDEFSRGTPDKAVRAINAQFLMQELTRRDQNRQAWIMIICTILIAVMTVAITVMTVANVYFTWLSLFCTH